MTTDCAFKGEEDLIQRCFAPLAAGFAGAFGLSDDCAVLAPPAGFEVVVKTDPVRAGVHFFADDAPEDIAWKALAVNVSDLVAKGATPHAYLLALALPERPDAAWLMRFAEGLRQAQAAFGCHLIGGDTDRAPGPLSIAVTAMGLVPAGRMVRRATARVGDSVFVSGTLGRAAFGLRLRRGEGVGWPMPAEQRPPLLQSYLRPQPRTALAPIVLAHASASMDVSDGLHKDLDRMCRASGTGGRFSVADLPVEASIAALIRAEPALGPLLWSGGDDYEILCTVPQARRAAFIADAASVSVRVTEIGRMTDDPGLVLLDPSTRSAIASSSKGWDHF